MIRSYNRTQTIKAVVYALGGFIYCGMAYGFFHLLVWFLTWQTDVSLPPYAPVCAGMVGLAVSWFSGYRVWKSKGGLYGYHESALYHDLGGETAGAVTVDFYAHRITGPAYLLGQIFMAGPQCILKSLTMLRSRIPLTHGLEESLENVLAMLRTANKWQGLEDYPDWQSEILYLAQMGKIDFSAYKGSPRFKAR